MLTAVQCSLVQNKYLMVLYTGIMHQSSDVAAEFSFDKKVLVNASKLWLRSSSNCTTSPVVTSVAIALTSTDIGSADG